MSDTATTAGTATTGQYDAEKKLILLPKLEPGTGKTSIILAKLDELVGLEEVKGTLKNLLAKTKTPEFNKEYPQKIIQHELFPHRFLPEGKTLFIDEAYQLVDKSPLSEEALARMKEALQENPGLAPRFNAKIEFQPYNEDEQRRILQKLAERGQVTISSDAALEEMLAELRKPANQESGVRSMIAVAKQVEARRAAAALVEAEATRKAVQAGRQQRVRQAARSRPKPRL